MRRDSRRPLRGRCPAGPSLHRLGWPGQRQGARLPATERTRPAWLKQRTPRQPETQTAGFGRPLTARYNPSNLDVEDVRPRAWNTLGAFAASPWLARPTARSPVTRNGANSASLAQTANTPSAKPLPAAGASGVVFAGLGVAPGAGEVGLVVGVDECVRGMVPGDQRTVGVPTGDDGDSSGNERSCYENLYHGILPYRQRHGA